MYSFALVHGDLTLNASKYATVTGADKIRQDLGLALREVYGSDRFHPRWGSILDQFIGLPLSNDVKERLKKEATRVVNNYIQVQNDQIKQDQLAGVLGRLDVSGIVGNLDSVALYQVQDSLLLTVTVSTLDNVAIVVQQQVSI